MMIATPSGTSYTLQHHGLVAQIAQVGAGLRTLTADGRALIDGYPGTERCTGARGHSMIPWPNRVEAGKYSWQGVEHQLDLSEPAVGGSIHGLTRWASWNMVEHEDARASFQHTLYPRQGWEWILDCVIEFSLDDDGLTVRTSATNVGADACPYGTGAHPYLTVGTPVIDSAMVSVPGSTYLPVDERGIPTGSESVEGTQYDLRSTTEIGDRRIDVAYTDLARGADGRATVRLVGSNGDAVSLWINEAYPFFEIFTGDTLPEPDRRRTGLGVEPMTCAPNAFNSGDGLVTLHPGETHRAKWGILPE